MVDKDKNLSLTVDERFNYSRPSIDVLFESAAEVFDSHLIGVILTGANNDGSNGFKAIKEAGGLAIIEAPAIAEVKAMPKKTLDLLFPNYILSLENIGPILVKLAYST